MIGINPIMMDVFEWTDKMAPELIKNGGYLGRLEDPKQWREWARSVMLINNEWQGYVPDPYEFDDWRDWAERLLQTVTGE
jgi:hypothetical protein